MRHAYRFIRAYSRYVGIDQGTVTALILEATRLDLPATVYAKTADGRWLDVEDLSRQAGRSSAAAYSLSKIYEYAGVSAQP